MIRLTLFSFLVLLWVSSVTVNTKPIVIIAGASIKAQTVPVKEKYKREDCPICKGKGWYISGDGIEKVECGYCEPPKPKTQFYKH